MERRIFARVALLCARIVREKTLYNPVVARTIRQHQSRAPGAPTTSQIPRHTDWSSAMLQQHLCRLRQPILGRAMQGAQVRFRNRLTPLHCDGAGSLRLNSSRSSPKLIPRVDTVMTQTCGMSGCTAFFPTWSALPGIPRG